MHPILRAQRKVLWDICSSKSARWDRFQVTLDVHELAVGMHVPLVWHSVNAQSVCLTPPTSMLGDAIEFATSFKSM
jgi:hypothetical protein